MYKNQLQELAQRSCFNLPSYTCFREGPDHAPRFKAAVNFNGETFESPSYCFTLRQAEHSAAEVALNALSCRGSSNSLAARILDETGVYKNLLQEVSQRVGSSLPVYTTFRTGLGHLPVFNCTVELASVIFTGEPAKNKKQAEKNAAMSAWLSLKSLVQQSEGSMPKKNQKDELEHVTVARALQKYLIKAKLEKKSFPIKFPALNPSPSSIQPCPVTTSKILPLICPKSAPRSNRPVTSASSSPVFQKIFKPTQSQTASTIANDNLTSLMSNLMALPQKFPTAGAAPYIPVRHCNPHQRIAPPVTIRNAIPVFSAPPLPSPQSSLAARPQMLGIPPPVRSRQATPVFAASPVRVDELTNLHPSVKMEDPRFSLEQPPISRAVSGRLEGSPFFKLPMLRAEEALGPKLLPACVTSFSEVPAVKSDPQTFEAPLIRVQFPVSVASSSATTAKASAKETRIAAQEMLQESAEMKM